MDQLSLFIPLCPPIKDIEILHKYFVLALLPGIKILKVALPFLTNNRELTIVHTENSRLSLAFLQKRNFPKTGADGQMLDVFPHRHQTPNYLRGQHLLDMPQQLIFQKTNIKFFESRLR
jgi:hypothetical protein